MRRHVRRTDRPRNPRFARIVGAAVVAVALWLAGLLWFAITLPVAAVDPERQADAIVVLTGGSGRLEQGIELLSHHQGQQLFVSGVSPGVGIDELSRTLNGFPQDLSSRIVLGHDAADTRGNATETAQWMRQQGFRSLRLVTATYHMPRSLLEFRSAMPDIEIMPHPVLSENFKHRDWWRWTGSATLLITEYTKYLFALARGAFSAVPQ
jgi:uncharacterized SAM-binding protein YcdF (DUF218 family)